jgi:hypothetical protein
MCCRNDWRLAKDAHLRFSKIGKYWAFIAFLARRGTFNGQNATFNARREAGDARRATRSGHRETFNVRREGDNGQNGTFNGRSTTGDVCRASCNADRETAIAHFTSDSVRREVACGHREICRTNPATGILNLVSDEMFQPF